MMNRFELGGCCLARYGAATPYFASKTDQIMSKYRPIAPKPVAQSSGGVVDAVQPQQPQPLAPPPVESSSRFRTCARSRKRSFDAAGAGGVSAPSSRGHKRTAKSRGNVSKAPSASASASASEGGRQQHQEKQSRLERGSPRSSVVLAVSGINQTAALRPHSDTSEGVVSALCEISDSAASKNFSLGRPCPSFGYSPPPCTSFDSTFVAQKNDGLMDKDAAFMERAAASASPNVNLPERRPTSKQGVISSEIVPQQPGLASDMQASAVYEADPLFDPPQLQPRQLTQDLITLPLLPIAPYRRESPSNSCVSNLSSRESSGNGNDNSIHPASFYNDDGQSLSEFSHFNSNACSNKMGMVTLPAPRSPLVDISLLEQLYSASSDPLLLTDDSYSHRVIWYNQAYKRLVSASEVGFPKPIASFILHKQSPFSSSLAVLWGFAEKLSGGHDMESTTTQSKRGVGVIMPQPLRPVGSRVVIECITDTNLQASPMSGSIREVEEQLESQNFPSLISDSNNRVRWTNTAYKQMVGQPECSWLESPAGGDKKSVKAARIHGEVLLVFNLHRFQLSEPLAAFSCCVKIQWTNGGEKSSMTVPCDVVRINGESHDYSYAWQFDIQAALCL